MQGNRLHHHIGAHESQNAHVNLWGLRVPLDQEGLRVVLGVELPEDLLADLRKSEFDRSTSEPWYVMPSAAVHLRHTASAPSHNFLSFARFSATLSSCLPASSTAASRLPWRSARSHPRERTRIRLPPDSSCIHAVVAYYSHRQKAMVV